MISMKRNTKLCRNAEFFGRNFFRIAEISQRVTVRHRIRFNLRRRIGHHASGTYAQYVWVFMPRIATMVLGAKSQDSLPSASVRRVMSYSRLYWI